MEMYIGAVERIQFYIDNGDSEADQSELRAVPISWPQKGDIVFEDVSLRYEKHGNSIVTGINLVIPAGQKVEILFLQTYFINLTVDFR